MGLLQDASLIVTPNAYKAGKLYSIVPSDGTGDFTVTRATSTTRVNSAGLIEISVTNLALQSEEFTNIIWSKGQSSVIENTAIAPNYTITADTFIANGINAVHSINQSLNIVNGIIYSYSVYVKKNTNDFIQLALSGASFGLNVWANFNLNTGVIGSVGSSTTNVKIENFNNSWYRCSISGLSTATGNITAPILNIVASESSIRGESNALATSVYIWGAQLEQNVSATEYIPTTSVVRTRFAGITQDGSIASNIPRLDYTNASCPSILVEPQRTNLLLYSDMFSNWGSTVIVTTNTDIAPDGTLSADTLLDNSTSFQPKSQVVTVPTNSTITASVFIKKTTGSISYYPGIAIIFQTISVRVARLILNSTTGTFNLEGVSAINVSAKVSSVNNYWKVELTATDSVSNDQVQFLVYPAISLDGITITPLAQGSNVFWGAQVELGGNATSYIPTTTATVTRNADINKINNNINLIGQTEGTIYIKFYKTLQTEGLKTLLILSGLTVNSDSIQILTPNNTTNISASIVVNGIIAGLSGGSRVLLDGLNKICLVYSTAGSKVFLNGVLTGTVSNVGLPPMFNINLGSLDGFRQWGFLNDIVLWKTQITDAEAIQLTTL